eukprot:gnl/MRDRNA2_/MRDRNA2_86613_c0_seq1.p1 gnl/MRDRNA2_/MRDRNA2_86613_c0~~gnl/MRDRNA2_/MRDRNA2_86613_c0_seq1.p1  ORF type:complete len:585 (+),score=90.56 gnl/MRDRNA2_/MRDRNA2_86613_c0_seq1:76-1830(+)
MLESDERPSEDCFVVQLRNCPKHGTVDVVLVISASSQTASFYLGNDLINCRKEPILESIPLEFSRILSDAVEIVTIDAGDTGGRWCFEIQNEEARMKLPVMLARAGALRTDFDREFRVMRSIRPSSAGRLAEVLLARPMHGRRAERAVKIAPPQDESLIREMRALRKLKHHPNIITMHEAYELSDPTRWAMVMDALDGGNLGQRVRGNGGPFGDACALQFLQQIFKALEYIHSEGMVHRDVKPDNVVLAARDENKLCLIDFGLACHESDPEMHRRCGTPGYVAPEVLLGRPYGCRVDSFSAGIVLYFLLKGIDPFGGGAPVPKVLKRNVRCNVSFEHPALLGCRSLLSACLQAEPTSRCTSAWAVEETRRLMAIHKDQEPPRQRAAPATLGAEQANPAYEFRVLQGENGRKGHFRALGVDKKAKPAGVESSVNALALETGGAQASSSEKSKIMGKKERFAEHTKDIQRQESKAQRQGTQQELESKASDLDKQSVRSDASWESWHVSSVASSSNASSSSPSIPRLTSSSSVGTPGGGGYPHSHSGPGPDKESVGRKMSKASSKRKTAAFDMFLQTDNSNGRITKL